MFAWYESLPFVAPNILQLQHLIQLWLRLGTDSGQHPQVDAYERENVCAKPPLILFHNLCGCISTGVRCRGVGFDLGGGLACTGDAKVGDVNFLFLVFSDAVNSVLFAGDSTVQLFGSMSLCFRFLP